MIQRATLLRQLADALEADRAQLVPLAGEESHLPAGRLEGELDRTTNQLRFFADMITDGTCFDAVIEHGDPDLRRVSVPIGPVLVFAASNFPFAFSVAGGDTASALAAGCPVTVKAHPGHPRLSDRVAAILRDAGAPVTLIHGEDAARQALLDPATKAAAFTGSTAGGRALFDLAVGRPDPIPFYGELGSINPTVVTPSAARERGPEIVAGFVNSFTLGVGQFCTKPGLLFLPHGHGLTDALTEAVRGVPAAPMLGDWIEHRYTELLAARTARSEVLHAGSGSAPTLLRTTAPALVDAPDLAEECFGPVSIVVEYADRDELGAALAVVDGSLTATVHAEPDEYAWARELFEYLSGRVGRIVMNGWPTGVAVTAAMHHGGPWPSSTAPLFSSVGGNAISRFLRPVSYQNVPDELLPPELQDANPLGIRRRVDGVWQ